MKAYRIVEWEHPPELVDAPVPEPGPGQVVVAVAGNGLCHSDAMMSQMPAAIGEAIGSLEDAIAALQCGADKVVDDCED